MMNIIETLKKEFSGAVESINSTDGPEVFSVDAKKIIGVLKFLKELPECPFDLFLDLCGVDYLGSEPRFEVVYHLYSLSQKKRIRLRVKVSGENPELPSAVSVYPIADWFEREAFDMFGIRFEGHPNLKRLLMWEGFEGHPLRKDYPIGKRQPIPTLGNLL